MRSPPARGDRDAVGQASCLTRPGSLAARLLLRRRACCCDVGPAAATAPILGRPELPLCYDPAVPFDIMGIRIPTIQKDNAAARCRGCGRVIDGTPFRVSVMDIVATEIPPSWNDRTPINPGPFQLHADPACARAWMRGKGFLFCRRSAVRELMRPIPVPGATPRWALCDGLHRDDHELIPA